MWTGQLEVHVSLARKHSTDTSPTCSLLYYSPSPFLLVFFGLRFSSKRLGNWFNRIAVWDLLAKLFSNLLGCKLWVSYVCISCDRIVFSYSCAFVFTRTVHDVIFQLRNFKLFWKQRWSLPCLLNVSTYTNPFVSFTLTTSYRASHDKTFHLQVDEGMWQMDQYFGQIGFPLGNLGSCHVVRLWNKISWESQECYHYWLEKFTAGTVAHGLIQIRVEFQCDNHIMGLNLLWLWLSSLVIVHCSV